MDSGNGWRARFLTAVASGSPTSQNCWHEAAELTSVSKTMLPTLHARAEHTLSGWLRFTGPAAVRLSAERPMPCLTRLRYVELRLCH